MIDLVTPLSNIDHYSIIVSLRLDAELSLYGHKKLGSQPVWL